MTSVLGLLNTSLSTRTGSMASERSAASGADDWAPAICAAVRGATGRVGANHATAGQATPTTTVVRPTRGTLGMTKQPEGGDGEVRGRPGTAARSDGHGELRPLRRRADR